MAARGLSGRQAVAAGVLSNYSLGQARQAQNRQFAAGVLSSESALHSAALQAAAGAMGGYNAGGQFMAQGNQMLGQYRPQIFTPESQVGTQAQGLKFQQDMAIAQANEASKMGAIQSLGSLASFGAMGGFNGLGNAFGNFGNSMKEFGGEYLGMNTWTEAGGGWQNGVRYSPSDW